MTSAQPYSKRVGRKSPQNKFERVAWDKNEVTSKFQIGESSLFKDIITQWLQNMI